MRNLVFVLLFSFIVGQRENIAQKVEPYFGAIIVNNIDSSVLWYSTVLNLKVENRTGSPEKGFRQANLSNGKLLIELIELEGSISPQKILEEKSPKARLRGIMKIGFKADNIDSMYNNFKEKKLTFRGNMVTDPLTGKRMFLLPDPDGNYIQFFEK
ncbi:MAG TPA: VOC family protein [Chitinophagaceae bacterium]|nr:VOC family protein [Chitinophagaceae bacterium]